MREGCSQKGATQAGFAWASLMLMGTPLLIHSVRPSLAGQQSEFARLAEQVAGQRLAGGNEDQAAEEKALAMLDAVVLPALNAPKEAALDALNRRLATLVTAQPGAGEGFSVLKLGGHPPAYALAANFGLAGPSAVRVYSSAAGEYVLTSRIDRFAQKDFFDEYLELIPVGGPADAPASLFVTVTGRTDGLQTGAFSAWTFDGTRLKQLWSSDLLPQSSYEAGEDGFRLTYCAEADDANPRDCRRMVRDLYVWNGSDWKRVEQRAVPVPKRQAPPATRD